MEKRTWSSARFHEATQPTLDDMDLDSFEKPPEYFWVKVQIPDESPNSYYGDAWIAHDKVLPVRRTSLPGMLRVPNFIEGVPSKYWDLDIPEEWCTPAMKESIEMDDVSSYDEVPEDSPWALYDFIRSLPQPLFWKDVLREIRKAFPDWSLQKIYDAADAASKTHPDLEGLLGVIPTFMKDEGIPEEEIPHRDWLAELDESVEVENVDDCEAPSQPLIAMSCGVCGAPLDAEGNYIENIPEGYDPDAYEHTYCPDCGNKEREEHRFQVTHEMALDAGDPSLEGTWW